VIRDLLIALFSALGLSAAGLLIALVTCVVRVKPEFPPPEPVQREP
jgi:hypothetical protein